jgi:hypothetical protein
VGRVILEIPLQVELRYRTSPSPQFEGMPTRVVALANGQEWTPDGYDSPMLALKVVQANGILKFATFFHPIALYDLGPGTLTVSGTIMLVRRGQVVWSGTPAEFSDRIVDALLRR